MLVVNMSKLQSKFLISNMKNKQTQDITKTKLFRNSYEMSDLSQKQHQNQRPNRFGNFVQILYLEFFNQNNWILKNLMMKQLNEIKIIF